MDEYDEGYGRVAAIENCDPNFLIYRKFGWLHCRTLLHIQDDLQKLERELEKEDERECMYGEAIKLKSRRKDLKGPVQKRQEILAKVHEKLKEYGTLPNVL